jgi:hypothetical protein
MAETTFLSVISATLTQTAAGGCSVAAAGLAVLMFEWWFYHRRTA